MENKKIHSFVYLFNRYLATKFNFFVGTYECVIMDGSSDKLFCKHIVYSIKRDNKDILFANNEHVKKIVMEFCEIFTEFINDPNHFKCGNKNESAFFHYPYKVCLDYMVVAGGQKATREKKTLFIKRDFYEENQHLSLMFTKNRSACYESFMNLCQVSGFKFSSEERKIDNPKFYEFYKLTLVSNLKASEDVTVYVCSEDESKKKNLTLSASNSNTQYSSLNEDYIEALRQSLLKKGKSKS